MSVSKIKGVVAAGLVTLTLTMLPLLRADQPADKHRATRSATPHTARTCPAASTRTSRPCGMIPIKQIEILNPSHRGKKKACRKSL